MSVNTHIQFVDEVHHEISIREIAEQMTEGQRLHMANHLWKHYGVGAQHLMNNDEPDEFIVLNGFVYKLGSGSNV